MTFNIGDWVNAKAIKYPDGSYYLYRDSPSGEDNATLLCKVIYFDDYRGTYEALVEVPEGIIAGWMASRSHNISYGCTIGARYAWANFNNLTIAKPAKPVKPVYILCRACGKNFPWIKGTSKRGFVCSSCRPI